MDLQLKDKVIIVTGGARGIGEGIVKVLAKEGAIQLSSAAMKKTTWQQLPQWKPLVASVAR